MEEIKGKRIILRKISKIDVGRLFEIFKDEEVAKYEWFKPMKSVQEAEEWLERYNSDIISGDELTWGIYEIKKQVLIGICCLGDFDSKARRAEIGYDIEKKFWGNGYATEAVELVTEFGYRKLDLNRIEAFITPGNDASVKVLEKCKYTREGLVRERDFIKGELVDGIIMARLKRD